MDPILSVIKGLILPLLLTLLLLVVGGRSSALPEGAEIEGADELHQDPIPPVSTSPIQNVIDLQCLESGSEGLTPPEPGSYGAGNATSFLSLTDADVCVAVSPKCLHDALKLMMEEMGKEEGEGALPKAHRFTEKDMACALLNLFHMGDKFRKIVDHFDHSLNHTQNALQTLSSKLEEEGKGQKRAVQKREEELLEKIQKNEERLNEIVEKHSIMEERQFFEIQELKSLLAEEKGKGEEAQREVKRLREKVEGNEEGVEDGRALLIKFGDKLGLLESRGSQVEVEMVQKLQKLGTEQEALGEGLKGLKEEVEGLRTLLRTELDKGTKSLKDTLLSPIFGAVEDLEGRVETLSTSMTGNVTEVKRLLSNEGLRAAMAEGELRKLMMEGKGALTFLERDLKAQIHTESLRAKGAEAQVTHILQKERERREHGAEEVKREFQGVKGSLLKLKKKGEALTTRLEEEKTRAREAEEGLLHNLNQELKRASEKEEQLSLSCAENAGKLSNLTESFGGGAETLEGLTSSLRALQALAEGLGERVEREESRAKDREVEIFRELGAELNSLRSHMKAEDVLLSERLGAAIYDRMTEKGEELRTEGARNHSASHDRINALTQFVTESEANYQALLTGLTEGLDRKFEGAERDWTKRLEKLEQDLRALLNKALTEKQGGGVFNRIVGFFGRRPVGTNATRTRTKSLKKMKREEKGEKGEEAEGAVESRLRVEPVFGDDDEGEEEVKGRGVVMVHSRGSKVREVYG